MPNPEYSGDVATLPANPGQADPSPIPVNPTLIETLPESRKGSLSRI